MQFTAGMLGDLSPKLIAELAGYRHKVFVEMLGWQLQSQNSLEFDQFDRADTLYVVARDYAGQINGCARLLPTTQPYLLKEVFPQLLNGCLAPSTSDVWELSRFAAVNFNAAQTSATGQFSSPIAVGLLRSALECAGKRGATRLITVSPRGVERLLRKSGFQAQRAGRPAIIEGSPLVACWIPCDKNIHPNYLH